MKNKIRILVLFAILISVKVSFAQDEFEMKNGDDTYIIKKYYMCFLKIGPDRSQDSVTAAKIQEGHLNNIFRLSKEGKILIAGPFGGNGELRGICIFDVKTKEEAEKLAGEDPAVKSGRLTAEILEWWGSKGSALK